MAEAVDVDTERMFDDAAQRVIGLAEELRGACVKLVSLGREVNPAGFTLAGVYGGGSTAR